ncbi:hypothetical protein [Aeoliella sp.]|uniref:hypothetical protein n=1 Tax=Aeoliella sp. TaxID=2795800 RepID=UPI003CCBF9A4
MFNRQNLITYALYLILAISVASADAQDADLRATHEIPSKTFFLALTPSIVSLESGKQIPKHQIVSCGKVIEGRAWVTGVNSGWCRLSDLIPLEVALQELQSYVDANPNDAHAYAVLIQANILCGYHARSGELLDNVGDSIAGDDSIRYVRVIASNRELLTTEEVGKDIRVIAANKIQTYWLPWLVFAAKTDLERLKIESAFGEAKIATALSSSDPGKVALAKLRAAAEDLESSISICDKVLETNPLCSSAYSTKAVCLSRMGRHADELMVLDLAISHWPEASNMHYLRGLHYFGIDNYDLAERDFRSSLKYRRDEDPAHEILLAKVLLFREFKKEGEYNQQNLHEGCSLARQVSKRFNHTRAKYATVYAVALAMQGDVSVAEEILDVCSNSNQNDQDALELVNTCRVLILSPSLQGK